ncbi:MAG: hypothetical protein ACXQTN_03820 [Methanoculleaceae archaeon]
MTGRVRMPPSKRSGTSRRRRCGDGHGDRLHIGQYPEDRGVFSGYLVNEA